MNNNYPGTKNEPFIVYFSKDWKTKEILSFPKETKIYKNHKYNWYRKILNFFRIKFKLFNCIKIKPIEKKKED